MSFLEFQKVKLNPCTEHSDMKYLNVINAGIYILRWDEVALQ